jgi:hypothetical protein
VHEPDVLARSLFPEPPLSKAEVGRITNAAIAEYGRSDSPAEEDDLFWLEWFVGDIVRSAVLDRRESIDSGDILLAVLSYDSMLHRELTPLLGIADDQPDDPLAALRERIASLRKSLGTEPN